MNLEVPGPFWLVGCGNMAGAMLERWLACGIDRSRVTVIRPSGTPVGEGVRVLTAFPKDEVPALVILGTKPQKLDEYSAVLSAILDPHSVLVSILAGIELASLRERFPAPFTVVKAMPNTPVKLGKGVTNLFSDSTDQDSRGLVEALMLSLGAVEWFDDELQFQAAGILTGAGPAFLFRFIDALAEAGAAIGLPPDQSARLACAMVDGAGSLAACDGETPAALAERVASPGGTTRAGLKVLDEDQALEALVRLTLKAGLARSREMAREARRSPS